MIHAGPPWGSVGAATPGALGAPDRSDVHLATRQAAPPQDALEASEARTTAVLRSLTDLEANGKLGLGAAAGPWHGGSPAEPASLNARERTVPLRGALAVAQAAVLIGRQVGCLHVDAADIADACMRASATGSGT